MLSQHSVSKIEAGPSGKMDLRCSSLSKLFVLVQLQRCGSASDAFATFQIAACMERASLRADFGSARREGNKGSFLSSLVDPTSARRVAKDPGWQWLFKMNELRLKMGSHSFINTLL